MGKFHIEPWVSSVLDAAAATAVRTITGKMIAKRWGRGTGTGT